MRSVGLKIYKLTWCCNDGSVAQIVALLLFSVKVRDPALPKRNKNSSRNCEILVLGRSGNLRYLKRFWICLKVKQLQTSSFLFYVEWHISRLLMSLHVFVCTQRISSIPCPLYSRTKARKKNEPNFAGNVPGCDLARMQSAISHSTGPKCSLSSGTLSSSALLPAKCFPLPAQRPFRCIKRTSLDRTNPRAFGRETLKTSCHISGMKKIK